MEESSHAHELPDIIDRLREFLKLKRYFILVDDLWDQSTWNIISSAFMDNGNGSRVMVTTRLEDVAFIVCHSDHACIYRMKQLEDQDSRILFFNRVFGSTNVCPPQFEEIAADILKKCGGLPLAIITIASLLASLEARSPNEWDVIRNSIGAKFSTKRTLEEMRGILDLSYMHLPVHLRPCLLYLGMYPEDVEIDRDDLVRKWIAEGLVCSLHGVDLDDTAKSYFNELINRSLIQPVDTFWSGIVSCRVHDMMLDLILSKCAEDNFISVAYNYEDMAMMDRYEYKVRRISMISTACGATSEILAPSLPQVRSYAQFGESKYTPPLSLFKYLRVLYFQFPLGWHTPVDLTAIGHLFLLRYLKVSAKFVGVALPSKIQGLVHLETLVLDCESTQSLPSDITRLDNLIHLILPYGTVLPEGIQNLKSVCTLHCSVMSKSSLEDIKGLCKLTNLKELVLSTPSGQCLTDECVNALVTSIGMLRRLKHLSLWRVTEYKGYGSHLDSLPDHPPRLEELDLDGWTCNRVPKWIGELRCLRILYLHVLHLSSDEVRVLGELPTLVSAMLHVSEISQNKVVVGTGLFPVLEDVSFRSYEDVTAYLSFEAGAMLKLQKLTLVLGWKQWRGATPVGMECLPCLLDIRVWLRYTGTNSSKNREDVRVDVESAFKNAVRLHPKHPSVTLD